MSGDRTHRNGGGVVDSEISYIQRARVLAQHDAALILGTILALLVFRWLLIDGLGMVADMVDMRIGGYEGLPSLILIYGIVVIGFNLLLGYVGLLSFGHAAFFGTAAYTAGIFSAQVSGSPILMVIAGTLVATLLAWPIGFLSIRRTGVYFAVLTLTFGQMLYFWALGPGAWLTDGDNGYSDIEIDHLLGSIELGSPVPGFEFLLGTWQYVFASAFTLLAVIVAFRIVRSPYGLVFRALGENEHRVSFVGLNVFRYKLMAFIISGTFAGVGGSLFLIHETYIHPTTGLYWITSGDFVIMSVLGGTGSLVGPVFGALVFEYISNVISGVTLPGIGAIGSLWRLFLGAAFVAIVWFLPQGIYGALKDVVGWLLSAIEFAVWAVRHPAAARRVIRESVIQLGGNLSAWIRGILSRFRLGGGR